MKPLHILRTLVFIVSAGTTPAWAGGSNPPPSNPPPNNPDKGTVAATLYSTDQQGDLSEWDSASQAVLNSATLPDGQQGFTTAVASNGTVYVASESSDRSQTIISSYTSNLSLINANVVTFASDYDNDGNPSSPSSMIVSGNTLYVTNDAYYNTDLIRVDLGATTPTATSIFNTQDSLEGLVTVGGLLYVSTYGAGTVETIDPNHPQNGATTFASIDGGMGTGGYMALSSDGTILYVDNWTNGSIVEYQVSNKSVINDDFINLASLGDQSVPGALAVYENDLFVYGNNGSTYEFDDASGDYVATFTGLVPPSNDFSAGPGMLATPEPRSWILGSLMIGTVGMIRRRLIAQ